MSQGRCSHFCLNERAVYSGVSGSRRVLRARRFLTSNNLTNIGVVSGQSTHMRPQDTGAWDGEATAASAVVEHLPGIRYLVYFIWHRCFYFPLSQLV